MIIERNLKKLIKDSIKKYPVVGLIGCRQVGKTTLAGVLQKDFGKRVVYPGEESYPLGRGAFTLPLKQIERLAAEF